MDSLIKITEVSDQLNISSRTLRYYEEVGLINSVRPQFEAYRFYDQANIERIKQICILRKMQIPIKDIKRIYEAQDIRVVVEMFLKSINDIDMKITSLQELRKITNEFVNVMLDNGITYINALPLIYDKMLSTLADEQKNQEEKLAEKEVLSYEKLSKLSQSLRSSGDPDIVVLSEMTMVSSIRNDTKCSDVEAFYDWLDMNGIYQTMDSQHQIFEYQQGDGSSVVLAKKPESITEAPFVEEHFDGGLFAAESVYVDEDINKFYEELLHLFEDHMYYQIDYGKSNELRYPILAETIHSIDNQREKIKLYVPIKKRHPDVLLYKPYEEIHGINVDELRKENPSLWTKSAALDSLTPIENPYYHMNEHGEAEFIPFIHPRRLSTNIEVRLPYQVDIEFKIEPGEEQFRYGADEGSIRIFHGQTELGINTENNSEEAISKHAISFRQPIFEDYHCYPKVGEFSLGEYHHLTWIIGERYMAAVIDDEVRFCGVNFPYMKMNLREEPAHNIIIGGNGQSKIVLKQIKVSQLRLSAAKLLKGDFTMNIKRSNNIISNIHPLITKMQGENYWFNGAAKYVMEAKGEKELGYEFWAGLTGDVFTQTYSYHQFLGDGCSEYFLSKENDKEWMENIFAKAGYAATFVEFKDLAKNKEMYLQTLISYIDQGVPVIWKKNDYTVWNVIVGYEESGKTLLYITDEMEQPEKVSCDFAMNYLPNLSKGCSGWIFVGGKEKEADFTQVLKEAVLNIPKLFAVKDERFCMGAEAFRAWAADIEQGKFDDITPEQYDDWAMYKSYVCCAATNSSCCYGFLGKTLEMNPDMTCIQPVMEQYKRMKELWGELEAIGGGFGVELDTLKDKAKAKKIADKIREFAVCDDKIAELLS